jgi:hypothetical protein
LDALKLICIGIALWVFYMAIKFYRSAKWDAPTETKERRKGRDRRRRHRRKIDASVEKLID